MSHDTCISSQIEEYKKWVVCQTGFAKGIELSERYQVSSPSPCCCGVTLPQHARIISVHAKPITRSVIGIQDPCVYCIRLRHCDIVCYCSDCTVIGLCCACACACACDWQSKQVNSVCGGIQGECVLFITCSSDTRTHARTHTHTHTDVSCMRRRGGWEETALIIEEDTQITVVSCRVIKLQTSCDITAIIYELTVYWSIFDLACPVVSLWYSMYVISLYYLNTHWYVHIIYSVMTLLLLKDIMLLYQ